MSLRVVLDDDAAICKMSLFFAACLMAA